MEKRERRQIAGLTRRPSKRILFLLWRHDGILECLRETELHDCLSRNLDRFARLRIAAHTCFTVGLYRLAQAGDYELSAALAFLRCQGRDLFENGGRDFLLDARLLCEG